MDLKRYKSHKEVTAGEIVRVDGRRIFLRLANGSEGAVDCKANMFTRYTPKQGDFLVCYDSGTKDEYLSFSPRDKFINSYTEVS